jgi:hypothetical protein
MLYGTRHALQLVVSIYSLRQVYKGPIAVLCAHDDNDCTSLRLKEALEQEPRLAVECVPFRFVTTGRRNNGYANKTLVHKISPFDKSVFLDADTLVVRPFDELFPIGDEIVLTQFAGWWSNQRKISRRIENWRKVDPVLVDRAQQAQYPAINTGVFGFASSTTYMDAWREMTLRNLSFICDELASQIMFMDYPHRVLDQRFNASVVYSTAAPEVVCDGRVWHGHGGKFFKKASGRAIWRPLYDACMRDDIARITRWTPYKEGEPIEEVRRCTTFGT